MQHLSFVVRWNDKEGNAHSKTYDTDPAARKAKAWLLEQGADSVDIAVSMGAKEYKHAGGMIPEGVKPPVEQPTFFNE